MDDPRVWQFCDMHAHMSHQYELIVKRLSSFL